MNRKISNNKDVLSNISNINRDFDTLNFKLNTASAYGNIVTKINSKNFHEKKHTKKGL